MQALFYFHKKLLNSIAGRYANVDVTMGYVKGTGGVNIGNPNQSQFGRFNSFSFSINFTKLHKTACSFSDK